MSGFEVTGNPSLGISIVVACLLSLTSGLLAIAFAAHIYINQTLSDIVRIITKASFLIELEPKRIIDLLVQLKRLKRSHSLLSLVSRPSAESLVAMDDLEPLTHSSRETNVYEDMSLEKRIPTSVVAKAASVFDEDRTHSLARSESKSSIRRPHTDTNVLSVQGSYSPKESANVPAGSSEDCTKARCSVSLVSEGSSRKNAESGDTLSSFPGLSEELQRHGAVWDPNQTYHLIQTKDVRGTTILPPDRAGQTDPLYSTFWNLNTEEIFGPTCSQIPEKSPANQHYTANTEVKKGKVVLDPNDPKYRTLENVKSSVFDRNREMANGNQKKSSSEVHYTANTEVKKGKVILDPNDPKYHTLQNVKSTIFDRKKKPDTKDQRVPKPQTNNNGVPPQLQNVLNERQVHPNDPKYHTLENVRSSIFDWTRDEGKSSKVKPETSKKKPTSIKVNSERRIAHPLDPLYNTLLNVKSSVFDRKKDKDTSPPVPIEKKEKNKVKPVRAHPNDPLYHTMQNVDSKVFDEEEGSTSTQDSSPTYIYVQEPSQSEKKGKH